MLSELTIDISQSNIILGVLLFLLGIAHMSPSIALWDARLFRFLHKPLRRCTRFFQLIWHLGRTPFTLVAIALLVIYNLHCGVIVSIIYALITIVEWLLKRSLRRSRPYRLIPDTIMGQPKEPADPSYPSGDAMRAWYLAMIIPTIFGLPWPFLAATCVLALLVTLGRIALGVHFPLDTIAGSGLGLLGAGIFPIFYLSFIGGQLPPIN